MIFSGLWGSSDIMGLSIVKGDNSIRITAVTDLLRDQNFLWYNFVFERELIILFSYLFLASLFSLLTSRLAIVFSNYLHLDEFFEISVINDFVSFDLLIHDMFLGLIIDTVRYHSDHQTMPDICH